MVDPLHQFAYWRSLPDKAAAVAREQTNQYTPDDLMLPLHKETPLPAGVKAEQVGLIAWYHALAKASLNPEHAEKYKAFARTLASF
jgi:hypothetical protein